MTHQPHYETTNRDRSVRANARLQSIEERKRLAMIDALQRMRQRTETVLADLRNAVIMLDHSIEAELQSSPTKDPAHYAFPMTARALIARRDNLKATIAALSDELSNNGRFRVAVA